MKPISILLLTIGATLVGAFLQQQHHHTEEQRPSLEMEVVSKLDFDATVEKIVTELDAACAKTGREGLKSLAKDLHARQQQFRRERAITQIRKHGGQLAGTGIEGEVEAEFGGAMAIR